MFLQRTVFRTSASPQDLKPEACSLKPTQKMRRIVEGHGATLVTGHDPEEWPKFNKAPDYYA